MWQGHAASRSPIARPERDHISAQLGRERRKALGGRRIDDQVLSDASALEQAGADGEQVLGLSMRHRLVLRVGLGGVTHIGERDLATSLSEQPPEGERIAIVTGPVVGNNHLRHGVSFIGLGVSARPSCPASNRRHCAGRWHIRRWTAVQYLHRSRRRNPAPQRVPSRSSSRTGCSENAAGAAGAPPPAACGSRREVRLTGGRVVGIRRSSRVTLSLLLLVCKRHPSLRSPSGW